MVIQIPIQAVCPLLCSLGSLNLSLTPHKNPYYETQINYISAVHCETNINCTFKKKFYYEVHINCFNNTFSNVVLPGWMTWVYFQLHKKHLLWNSQLFKTFCTSNFEIFYIILILKGRTAHFLSYSSAFLRRPQKLGEIVLKLLTLLSNVKTLRRIASKLAFSDRLNFNILTINQVISKLTLKIKFEKALFSFINILFRMFHIIDLLFSEILASPYKFKCTNCTVNFWSLSLPFCFHLSCPMS